MHDPHAPRTQPEPIYERTPVDEAIEHEEGDVLAADYREAARRFSMLLNRAAIFILDATDKRLAVWQVAYAIGLPVCEGKSMTERADSFGLTRQAFSKGAKAFLRSAHLPPSEHMKSIESTASYALARTSQLS